MTVMVSGVKTKVYLPNTRRGRVDKNHILFIPTYVCWGYICDGISSKEKVVFEAKDLQRTADGVV